MTEDLFVRYEKAIKGSTFGSEIGTLRLGEVIARIDRQKITPQEGMSSVVIPESILVDGVNPSIVSYANVTKFLDGFIKQFDTENAGPNSMVKITKLDDGSLVVENSVKWLHTESVFPVNEVILQTPRISHSVIRLIPLAYGMSEDGIQYASKVGFEALRIVQENDKVISAEAATCTGIPWKKSGDLRSGKILFSDGPGSSHEILEGNKNVDTMLADMRSLYGFYSNVFEEHKESADESGAIYLTKNS